MHSKNTSICLSFAHLSTIASLSLLEPWLILKQCLPLPCPAHLCKTFCLISLPLLLSHCISLSLCPTLALSLPPPHYTTSYNYCCCSYFVFLTVTNTGTVRVLSLLRLLLLQTSYIKGYSVRCPGCRALQHWTAAQNNSEDCKSGWGTPSAKQCTGAAAT